MATASKSLEQIDSDGKRHDDNNPSPTDIEIFIPWACRQLQLPCFPILSRVTLSDPARANTTRPTLKEDVPITGSQSASEANISKIISSASKSNVVYIDTVYDIGDSLIQVKFKRNSKIPESLLQLFSLIVQFHPNLSAIYIDKGLNQKALYQVSKIVATSNITEVILDNTILHEANYYLLLEDKCCLKYLSLARCMLNDTALKLIVSRLEYPLKASKTLTVLNLSSNQITDEGAKYLGDMLRANRKLSYLNLSDNRISDIGADDILSSLIMFSLTNDEITKKKARKFNYMKEKNKFINETAEKLRIDFEKKYATKKRNNKSVITPTKGTKSVDVSADIEMRSMGAIDPIWFEKAQDAAEEMVGPFQDAFSTENTIVKGEILYCYGNNTLCYLNVAYNNLTYFSVQKLYKVISTQRSLNRRPSGLINVCIEGNNLPQTCQELAEIEMLLETGLTRTSIIAKKKFGPKPGK